MAAPGFIDLPSTPHFAFEFNEKLNSSDARALGKALFDTAEQDYAILRSFFGGINPSGVPFDVKIDLGTGGASNDTIKNIDLRVGATSNFNQARATLVAEVIEIFMATDPFGWNPLDSSGEGLSQAAVFTLYPDQAQLLNGPQVWLDTSVSPGTINQSRPDFVSKTEKIDSNFVSFGCALLFIYYLRLQLGFNMKPIVGAAASTLKGVYINLTQDQGGGVFQTFSAVLNSRFPTGQPSNLAGSTNPFPLPSRAVLSAKQFLVKNEVDPQLLGQIIRANNEMGNLRALLNSDRPTSLVR
jgi:hypothetical protein